MSESQQPQVTLAVPKKLWVTYGKGIPFSIKTQDCSNVQRLCRAIKSVYEKKCRTTLPPGRVTLSSTEDGGEPIRPGLTLQELLKEYNGQGLTDLNPLFMRVAVPEGQGEKSFAVFVMTLECED